MYRPQYMDMIWPLFVKPRPSPCHRVVGYHRTPSASPEQPGLSWFCGAACLDNKDILSSTQIAPLQLYLVYLSKHKCTDTEQNLNF